MFFGCGILSELRPDVGMEPFSIHDERSAEGRCQLLGSEYRAVVLRINSGIVAIPLSKVDVPLSSQCVGFGTEFPGSKPNDQVERGKVFGPSCLPTCEDFGR